MHRLYGYRISTSPSLYVFRCSVRAREGYQNLCQLITRFKMREATKQEGSARLAEIEDYSRGIICLTGGDEGPLAAALMRGGEAEGLETVERLVRIFGDEQRLRRVATSP